MVRAYVGTYTRDNSEGIYTFVLDPFTETLKEIQLAYKQENPSYLTLSPDSRYLYSIATKEDKSGISAYKVNENTGQLEFLNEIMMKTSKASHLHINSKNQLVLANYNEGTVEAYELNEDGALNQRTSIVCHKGYGPNKKRQEKAHIHFAHFTQDEDYVVTVDLGTDQVVLYELTKGLLKEVNTLSLHPGCGPRHLAFHPNGKFAYVIAELSNELIVLEYYTNDGSFKDRQYVSTIPKDFTEVSQGSAIHISNDGRFVYVSNRGHNSMAVFCVNEENGQVQFVEHMSTYGDCPRDFALDPSNRYLVCANEKTNNLVLYKRDQKTGKLIMLQSDYYIPEPSCIQFMKE